VRAFFAIGLALIALAQPATAGAATKAFTFTGAPQSWRVPPNVIRATVDLWGGRGGGYHPDYGGPGGKGAHVRATIAVTPGETLGFFVGGAALELQDAGAFNGGGNGGTYGAGGGGATDVRRGTGVANRIAVAAGGGGGSQSISAFGLAGATGGDSGADGGAGSSNGGIVAAQGGKKGTQTSGGAGGAPSSAGGVPGASGGVRGQASNDHRARGQEDRRYIGPGRHSRNFAGRRDRRRWG
jgi:hypothetical protein